VNKQIQDGGRIAILKNLNTFATDFDEIWHADKHGCR